MNRTTLALGAWMLMLPPVAGVALAQQYDRGGQVIPGTEVDSRKAAPIVLPRERLPEQPPQAPRVPISTDLVPIEWSHAEGDTAAVDRASVSVDPDDVVRYVLIMIGADGKRQVTFEGIRCDPNEWRVYAFGRSEGGWVPNHTGRWQPAYEAGPGAPRHVLAKDFFCTLGRRPTPDARNALDAGGGSSVLRRRDN